MTPDAAKKIERTLWELVGLLVEKDYGAIEQLTHGVRLPADDIRQTVDDYGRTLMIPPAEAFSAIDVVPIRSTSPEQFSVRFRLSTLEEGSSDLEIQATLIDEAGTTVMRIELDGTLVA